MAHRLHTVTFLSAGTKGEAERLSLQERWDYLCRLEMVGEEGAFVIGREEVLTAEELTTTLKVRAENGHLMRKAGPCIWFAKKFFFPPLMAPIVLSCV